METYSMAQENPLLEVSFMPFKLDPTSRNEKKLPHSQRLQITKKIVVHILIE